jgi:hypothetical protein
MAVAASAFDLPRARRSWLATGLGADAQRMTMRADQTPVKTPRRLLLARADMLRKIEKGKRVFALIAFKKR